MARPSSISDALIGLIADEVAKGNYPEVAACAAGVCRATYFNWLARGERDKEAGEVSLYAKFLDAVKEAEATAQGLLLNKIYTAPDAPGPLAPKWQAAAWILERRWRGRWGRTSATEDDFRLRKLAAEAELAELQLRQARRMAGEDNANPAEGYADPLCPPVGAPDADAAATGGGGDDRA